MHFDDFPACRGTFSQNGKEGTSPSWGGFFFSRDRRFFGASARARTTAKERCSASFVALQSGFWVSSPSWEHTSTTSREPLQRRRIYRPASAHSAQKATPCIVVHLHDKLGQPSCQPEFLPPPLTCHLVVRIRRSC